MKDQQYWTRHLLYHQHHSLSSQASTAGWIAISALVVTTLVGLAAGGGLLNLAFPTIAFGVGVFLYFRTPILYMGFSWWMWVLAPLVRRLADYRGAFTDPSPILLTPYLVTFIAIITFLKWLPYSYRREGLPFVLAFLGVSYAFIIGLLLRTPFEATRGFLDWVVPIPFGFCLLHHWRDYPHYRQNMLRVFTWAALVMGVYGIIQYVSMPEWDRLWVFSSNMITAAGDPDDPERRRIWSTMQSGEPFAAFMAAALLVLLSGKGWFYLPPAAAGYLSFLLAMVRSAWMGWFVGLMVLFGAAKVKHQLRFMIMVVLLAMMVVPLVSFQPFSVSIGDRLSTLSMLHEDGSAVGRQEDFRNLIGSALLSVIGRGVGSGSLDNSILAMLFDLGWLGSLLYTFGLGTLTFRLFQGDRTDFFAVALRAGVVTVLVRIPVNGAVLGVSGVVLWSFLGLGLAAERYWHDYRLRAHLLEPESELLPEPADSPEVS